MGNRQRPREQMILRAVVAWLICAVAAQAEGCEEGAVYVRGDWGQARFSVEIADDDAERAQGLMYRTEMASAAGMLFIYPQPQSLSFWMRNTLIELDIIFVDPTGVVRHVHSRAQPLDETPIPGGQGLTHVLEINGGLSARLGIKVGDALRHPSFSQAEAAWPC